MEKPFLDSTTLDGQRRIRSFALCWLEKLDYTGRLDRSWPADALGARLWARFEKEYAPHWQGPLVTNRGLAEVVATTMVEDYYSAYPSQRAARYTVAGPLDDCAFRRCVLDFVHDLEEYEPERLPHDPAEVVQLFWSEVRQYPDRWGYDPETGPFVDDEVRAGAVAVDVVRDYLALKLRVAEVRARDARTTRETNP